ncbi:MAG TPA: AsmA family protein [Rhizomicrobium sp.]|nr:AsmA family protein [Rhizomicrobium sp.]
MTIPGPDNKPGWRARARKAGAVVSGEMARICASVQRRRAAHAAYREGHPRPLWLKILGWAALAGIAGLVALAFVLPGNAFRGVVQHWATQKAGRDVHIGGDLHMNLLSWTPKVVAQDVTIANPDWLGSTADKKEPMANIPRLAVKLRLLPLLTGQWVVQSVRVTKPEVHLVRLASGRANWDFRASRDDANTPLVLPPIRRFVVKDGHLTIHDLERDLIFSGTVSSHESITRKHRGFQMVGDGKLNRQDFHADVHGGPLINVNVSEPYNFNADVRAGSTHIVAKGTITHPFDLGGFAADVKFSGADLSQLYDLTGLTLPGTPPYAISGHLVRDGQVFTFNGFSGTVGDSDLSGDLKVDASSGRPNLTADLTSRNLDFDDLGPMFGAPPAIGKGETASPTQTANAKKKDAAQARAPQTARALVLPNVPLRIERVRQMDAHVTYRADAVHSQDFPLRKLSLDLTLDHGVLTLNPVSFRFSQGKLSGKVKIDARKDVPRSDVDMRLTDARLEHFVQGSVRNPIVEGRVEARALVQGRGDSVHKAASTANGTVSFVIPRGKIRKSVAELLGIDVTRALGLVLTGDKSQTDLRCAVASFHVENGVLHTNRILLDTDVVKTEGSGTINMRNEAIDLKLDGKSKKLELFHINAPITIGGHLSNPSIGVVPGKAAAQGGLAIALGVLATPLAAILPFVSPGLAKDENCAALLNAAKRDGAPLTKKDVQQTGK